MGIRWILVDNAVSLFHSQPNGAGLYYSNPANNLLSRQTLIWFRREFVKRTHRLAGVEVTRPSHVLKVADSNLRR